MRLASGLAQVVNYMLGIYAEPPFGLHGWTDTYWGKFYIYIYIFIQSVYTYICICIHTYTHACNRHYSKEGQQNTQPEQQALALRIQYARSGVCAS